MYFVYGEADERTRKLALTLANSLKSRNTSKTGKLTGTRGVERTKLEGRALLKPSLGVDKKILDYLDAVMDARGSNPPEKRTLSKMPYPVPINQFLQ